MSIANSKSNRILFINNKLRSLGIKPSHDGYCLLIKLIEYRYENYNEFEFNNLDDMYKEIAISIKNSKTPTAIRTSINYALSHRNEKLSKENFEKVFGYSYSSELFTNKEFIEAMVNLLVMNSLK